MAETAHSRGEQEFTVQNGDRIVPLGCFYENTTGMKPTGSRSFRVVLWAYDVKYTTPHLPI